MADRSVDPPSCSPHLPRCETAARGHGWPRPLCLTGDREPSTSGATNPSKPGAETTCALTALLSPARCASTRPQLQRPRRARGPPWQTDRRTLARAAGRPARGCRSCERLGLTPSPAATTTPPLFRCGPRCGPLGAESRRATPLVVARGSLGARRRPSAITHDPSPPETSSARTAPRRVCPRSEIEVPSTETPSDLPGGRRGQGPSVRSVARDPAPLELVAATGVVGLSLGCLSYRGVTARRGAWLLGSDEESVCSAAARGPLMLGFSVVKLAA